MITTPPVFSANTRTLAPFVEAGLLMSSDVYVADTIARVTGKPDHCVVLAAAFAVRAVREGHVCITLPELARSVYSEGVDGQESLALGWPDPDEWRLALSQSPAVRSGDETPGEWVAPLVLDGERVYLDRYWRYESDLADDLVRRSTQRSGLFVADVNLELVLDGLFGPVGDGDRQRAAARLALTGRLTIIAGGPGTGKTRTLARALRAASVLAKERGIEFLPALAAPTATAAKRMTQALQRELDESNTTAGSVAFDAPIEAMTLHRLLGARRSSVFSFCSDNQLPYNFVIIDEVSMVSLPLMAHLLEALAAESNLVLVGDPSQLASVEAGAVLEEIVARDKVANGAVGPLAGSIVHLDRQHRFDEHSLIAQLSIAVRDGQVERAMELLGRDCTRELCWVRDDDGVAIDDLHHSMADLAVEVVERAHAEDVAGCLDLLGSIKVLAATRHGDFGMYRWSDLIESHLARQLSTRRFNRPWYVGRPVIVNRNDNLNRIYNGDVGVVVNPERPVVAMLDGSSVRYVPLSQLDDVDTWWAMTIHKSQGSEFDHVVVSLPLESSPILTRELLYTAITRARHRVTLVASERAIRAAISRPVGRSSGLGEKLWSKPPPASHR